LREAFIATFSKEAILDPTKRVMDRTWQNILVQVRSMFVKCPICGKPTFVNVDGGNSICLECGKTIERPALLKMGKYLCPVVPEQKIYQCQVSFDNDYEKVVGEVIRNPKDPNKWGIRNLSGMPWTITTASGEIKNIDHNGVVPVMAGLKIRFTKDVTGELI
jgi:ribosomal protein L37AE/L43A